MESLTAWVGRHRLLVALAWIAVAVAGGVLAPRTVDSLSYDFGLPGQPAYEANQDIVRTLGVGGLYDPVVMTARGDFGQDTARQEFAQRIAGVARAAPGTRVVTDQDAPDLGLVSTDGTRAVALLYPPIRPGPEPYAASLPALQKAAAASPGPALGVTSTDLLAENGGDSRGVLIEIIFGAIGALVVLALVFASLLAGVPLLIAAVSILGTFLALLGLTQITDVSFVVQYLIGLIGLGVAIDYSLLITMRWREERLAGRENDDAVRAAMVTAGRSVAFSGVTVAVSLAALVAVPLPFLRSIGLGGLLIPLFSVAAALTLVPALLLSVGPRLEWPRRRIPAHRESEAKDGRWAAVARFVVRRRWAVIVVSALALLALAAPVFGLRLGSPEVSSYSGSSGPVSAARGLLDSGLSPGLLRPTQVLVAEDRADQAVEALREVSGIRAARPTGEGWSADGRTLVQVVPRADPATDAGKSMLKTVRDVAEKQGAEVGGTPAEDADFVSAVYSDAPLVLLLIIVVTFLLLARALRSFWLPIKALVLNVISIGAAYGLTVLVWQHGVGTQLLFNADPAGAVTPWVPVAVFAFLFGLSMDYEVFLLARMREAHDDGRSTPDAVVDGVAHTGRLVTSAALILFLSFVALSTVPVVDVKILATGLAFGILIDAVVVRSLLAPALVAVLGRANWTLPRWLGWIAR